MNLFFWLSASLFSVPVLAADPLLQRLLHAEHQRIGDDKLLLDTIRHGARPDTVKRAMLTAARIGSPDAIPALSAVLNQKRHPFRPEAAFALGQINDPMTVVLLSQHLSMNSDVTLRAALLLALGRAGKEAQLGTLCRELLEATDERLLAAAAEGLGNLLSQDSAKWAVDVAVLNRLLELAAAPREAVALPAAFALARYKGSQTLPTSQWITTINTAGSTATKALLARAVGRNKDAAQVDWIGSLFHSSPAPAAVRAEAVKGLSSHTNLTPTIVTALTAALGSREAFVVAGALDAVSSYAAAAQPLEAIVKGLLAKSPSVWIQREALKTWARINPTTARNTVHHLLASSNPLIGQAAAEAIGSLALEQDWRVLEAKLATAPPGIIAAAGEGLKQTNLAELPSALKDRITQFASQSTDVAVLTVLGELAENWKWKDLARILAQRLPKLSSVEHLEAKVTILGAIKACDLTDQADVVRAFVYDRERMVAKAAVETLFALKGEDLSKKVTAHSPAVGATPNWSDAERTFNKRVMLQTNRGKIVIQLSSQTPLTNLAFLRLVQSGFYSNRLFHRMVPNFVIQGGDPRGDGYGGPGFFIRDEISSERHDAMTVGIATAGKDTGGCQFFINTAPNLHLGARYTLFARVIEGRDTALSLELGDKLLSASSIP